MTSLHFWLKPEGDAAHKCSQEAFDLPSPYSSCLPLAVGLSSLCERDDVYTLLQTSWPECTTLGLQHCLFKTFANGELYVVGMSHEASVFVNSAKLRFGVECALHPGTIISLDANGATRWVVETIPTDVAASIRSKTAAGKQLPDGVNIDDAASNDLQSGARATTPPAASADPGLRQQLHAKLLECQELRSCLLATERALADARAQLRSEQAHHCASKAVFDAQQQSLEDTLDALLTERGRSKKLLEELHAAQQRALQNELHLQAAQTQIALLKAFQPTLERLGAVVQGAGAQLKAVQTSMNGHEKTASQGEAPAQTPPPERAVFFCDGRQSSTNPHVALPADAAPDARDASPEETQPAAGSAFNAGNPAAASYPPMAPPADAAHMRTLSGAAWGDHSPHESLRRSSQISDMMFAHLGGGADGKLSLPGQASFGQGGAGLDADAFVSALRSCGGGLAGASSMESSRDMLLRAVSQLKHPMQQQYQQQQHQMTETVGGRFGGFGAADAPAPDAPTDKQLNGLPGWCEAGANTVARCNRAQTDNDVADQRAEKAPAPVKYLNMTLKPRALKRCSDGMGSQESDVSTESYDAKPLGKRRRRPTAHEADVLEPPKDLRKIKTKVEDASDSDKLQLLADLASLDPDLSDNEDEGDNTPLAVATPRACDTPTRTPQPPSAHHVVRRGVDALGRVIVSKHGRRINPRKGIPMHVMATYALLRLPNHEGNLTEMATEIERNETFCSQLDWTARPGTRTYPRWKDALVGCFKPGRYPHLFKTDKKKESLTVYTVVESKIPEKSRLSGAQAGAHA